MTTHLVIPDPHAHYQHNNDRADWLSQLILDVQPDVVINLGDQFDMPSLSSYDKGKKSFVGRTYQQDIEAGLEFSERLWEPIKRRKKKMPERVFLIGNHEERISRAIELSPELDGTIGYEDLDLNRYYDHVIAYNGHTPSAISIDGITYAHYITGISGRPISTEHTGFSLISKRHVSVTVGHNHLFNYSIRNVGEGSIHGLSAGCFFDYESDWAGEGNRLYNRGVVIKRNVHAGAYDIQWVSIEALRKEYS